jgi:hypothetical protein
LLLRPLQTSSITLHAPQRIVQLPARLIEAPQRLVVALQARQVLRLEGNFDRDPDL